LDPFSGHPVLEASGNPPPGPQIWTPFGTTFLTSFGPLFWTQILTRFGPRFDLETLPEPSRNPPGTTQNRVLSKTGMKNSFFCKKTRKNVFPTRLVHFMLTAEALFFTFFTFFSLFFTFFVIFLPRNVSKTVPPFHPKNELNFDRFFDPKNPSRPKNRFYFCLF